MNQEELLKSISDNLVIIKKLLLLDVVKDKESKEAIKILSGLGLQPTEIGDLLGKTPGAVRVAKHRTNKANGKNNDR